MLSFLPDAATLSRRERLTDVAFDVADPVKLYLLLDAAADPDIHVHLDAFPEDATCLFGGEVAEDLADVGPWLAEPKRHGDLWMWFLEEGWGNNWGVMLHTRLPMVRVRQHLKKFLRVDQEGEEATFFKFYRPEHLQTYLPIFTPEQVNRFCKNIDAWLFEQEGGASLGRFSCDEAGNLMCSDTTLDEG